MTILALKRVRAIHFILCATAGKQLVRNGRRLAYNYLTRYEHERTIVTNRQTTDTRVAIADYVTQVVGPKIDQMSALP